MALRAAFAQVDITPAVGCLKAGWLRRIVADTILDPLFAKVLVLEDGGCRIGFVSLDTLSVRWRQVCHFRAAGERLGIAPSHLMVAATHNHAGPAVATIGDVPRDDAYLAMLQDRVGEALARAVEGLAPARVAVESCTEGRISFPRRFRMKDGSVKTHPPARSPQIRCAEGVVDPEVGVLCVRSLDDRVLGFVVNFACHPTHHGGDGCISAGFPGRLAAVLRESFGPDCVTLFLNGAFGDLFYGNPFDPDLVNDMDHMGRVLASDVVELMPRMTFVETAALGGESRTVEVEYRELDGPHGVQAPFAQPFISTDIYERARAALRDRIARERTGRAEVQRLTVGDSAWVGVPAEYFCALGLRIKMASACRNTYVVGAANGMIGYVPTREAFEGGGYETTVAPWSRSAPDTGDRLAAMAIQLVGRRS